METNSRLLVQMTERELRSLINDAIQQAVKPMPEQDEILLKRKDVAKKFSVSLVTINEWMKSGKLPYHRINSRIFFKKQEVLEAMTGNKKYKSTSNAENK